MRIISPFPAGKTAIIVNGKGSCRIVVNGEAFQRVPWEDPWAQGIDAGYVDVPVPELDEGCFTLSPNSAETTDGGNTLVTLTRQADFPHNRFAP